MTKRNGKRGRPCKSYEESGREAKRLKVHDVMIELSVEMLCDSFKKSLQISGYKDGPRVIDKILESPQAATRILQSLDRDVPVEMSPEDALAFFVNCDMTKEKYTRIRKNAMSYNVKLYPEYRHIAAQKKFCAPENIEITETKCVVPLQDALNHCAKRLILFLELEKQTTALMETLLTVKYGFDGTSSNSYRQQWTEPNSGDSHMFCSSFVPLKLERKNTGETLWENPKPSSTRLCFPIKIEYLKESSEGSRNEQIYLQDQINMLQPYCATNVQVAFSLSLTMIDGKVGIQNRL